MHKITLEILWGAGYIGIVRCGSGVNHDAGLQGLPPVWAVLTAVVHTLMTPVAMQHIFWQSSADCYSVILPHAATKRRLTGREDKTMTDETGKPEKNDKSTAFLRNHPAAQKAMGTVTEMAAYLAGKQTQPNDVMESIMSKTQEKIEHIAQQAASTGKDNADAWVKSGNIFLQGYQDLVKTYVGLAQEAAEKNGKAFKTLLSCKDVGEFTEAQTRLAQQNFDDLLNNTTKLSEMSVKLATETFAPINDQLSKAVKKATDSVAA